MIDNNIVKALDGADVFLRDRAGSKPSPLNEYDIALLLDIAKTCDEAGAIITRQKEYIESLEAEIDKQYKQVKADILGNMANGGMSCPWCIKQRRADTIKEFAERLKETKIKCPLPLFGLTTKSEIEDYFNETLMKVREAIDNLAKEMTEETKHE